MLKVMGVGEGQLEAVSFGEDKPQDPGHDEGAYSKNRRADFYYP
jgi:peptidoglycan-associated lipoprotein